MDGTNGSGGKAWYQRPENFTGLLLIGGLLYGGLYLAPYVILAATNMLYMGFLLAALGGISFAVLDSDIRTSAFYAWKTLTKKITGVIINMDPIAIITIAIAKMKEKLAEIIANKNAVGGRVIKMKKVIGTNASKAEEDMRLAEQADKTGNKLDKIRFATEAQKLRKSNENLQVTLNKLETMFAILEKMAETVQFRIDTNESDLEIKKVEYEAIKESNAALKSGFKLLSGDSEEKRMMDLALENISDTMSLQLSEIDDIIKASATAINRVDLEKGVIKEDALAAFDKWTKQNGSALLGTDKAVLLSQSYDDSNTIDVTPKAKVLLKSGPKTDKFSKLLK